MSNFYEKVHPIGWSEADVYKYFFLLANATIEILKNGAISTIEVKIITESKQEKK